MLVSRTAQGSPTTAPYDVWAAVGRDQGNNGPVFSAPVRVSSQTGAYPAGSGGGGDDYSFILADNKYVHVGWGDSRSGFTQVWYGRIPLPNFAGQGPNHHARARETHLDTGARLPRGWIEVGAPPAPRKAPNLHRDARTGAQSCQISGTDPRT